MKAKRSIVRADIIRQLLTASIAMLALTLFACEDKEKKQTTAEAATETTSESQTAEQPAAPPPTQEAAPPTPTTFTDTRDNKTYKTVKIGTQVWMAENLNYEVEGSMCYDNKPDNCKKYGRLYYWNTATEVCPNGWHLPSPNDWSKLLSYVDGTSGTDPYESKTVGKYLKAKSWDKNNGEDKFGFSALPGGNGDESGGFALIGSNGFWWGNTSDEFYLFMTDIDDIVRTSNINGEDEGDFRLLLSVRCIKD